MRYNIEVVICCPGDFAAPTPAFVRFPAESNWSGVEEIRGLTYRNLRLIIGSPFPGQLCRQSAARIGVDHVAIVGLAANLSGHHRGSLQALLGNRVLLRRQDCGET